jgi:hypothetical protein
MKVLFTIICVGFLSSISFAQKMPAAQFENGNDISIKEKYGTVTYYCNDHLGNNYTRQWNCYAADVNPGTHDYFVSNNPIDADNVTLTAVREDGSKKTKKVGYNSEKSTSDFRINLLVRSLTQSPLLKIGANKVSYEFTKKKKSVATGDFTSTVTLLESKKCRPRSEFAVQPNVCEYESFGCDRYFYMENHCNY